MPPYILFPEVKEVILYFKNGKKKMVNIIIYYFIFASFIWGKKKREKNYFLLANLCKRFEVASG